MIAAILHSYARDAELICATYEVAQEVLAYAAMQQPEAHSASDQEGRQCPPPSFCLSVLLRLKAGATNSLDIQQKEDNVDEACANTSSAMVWLSDAVAIW